jgi:uncharacterized RDD family membrane protein YckC
VIDPLTGVVPRRLLQAVVDRALIGAVFLVLLIAALVGGEPALGAYAARWLLDVVDGALFGLVGVVLIVVTPRHQRLGDLVAGTLVVRLSALSAPAGSATPR